MEKIVILGGDARSRAIRDAMKKTYPDTASYYMGEREGTDVDRTLREAEAVILPIPVSTDGERLFCPQYAGNAPYLRTLFGSLRSNCLLFGGRISQEVRIAAAERHLLIRDMLSPDEVAIENGILTAEGAVLPILQAVLREK